MTEQEWQDCSNPYALLEFLRGKISDRKLRLFGVACCQRVWHLLEEDSRLNVELAESLADQPVKNESRIRETRDAAHNVAASLHNRIQDAADPQSRAWIEARAYAANAARESVSTPKYVGCVAAATNFAVKRWAKTKGLPPRPTAKRERAHQSHLLRDLAGNPFSMSAAHANWLAWRGGLASAIAASIYRQKLFNRMPILADALEVAGCSDAYILNHLRGPGPHVRGCWVLDWLLGKT